MNIVEGKEETLNVELSSTAKISFSSTPSGAGVLIDGTLEGSTPFTKEMASGTLTSGPGTTVTVLSTARCTSTWLTPRCISRWRAS